jgi:hypothetical protein
MKHFGKLKMNVLSSIKLLICMSLVPLVSSDCLSLELTRSGLQTQYTGACFSEALTFTSYLPATCINSDRTLVGGAGDVFIGANPNPTYQHGCCWFKCGEGGILYVTRQSDGLFAQCPSENPNCKSAAPGLIASGTALAGMLVAIVIMA